MGRLTHTDDSLSPLAPKTVAYMFLRVSPCYLPILVFLQITVPYLLQRVSSSSPPPFAKPVPQPLHGNICIRHTPACQHIPQPLVRCVLNPPPPPQKKLRCLGPVHGAAPSTDMPWQSRVGSNFVLVRLGTSILLKFPCLTPLFLPHLNHVTFPDVAETAEPCLEPLALLR